MTNHNPQHDLIASIAGMMEAIQRQLLADGYVYLAGDVAAWPLTDVVMARDEQLLIVAVWTPNRAVALRNRWAEATARQREAIGLLLIGDESPASEAVDDFFGATRGAIGYVDARMRYCRVRSAQDDRAPDVLTGDTLARLLEAGTAAAPAGIDARAALQASQAGSDDDDGDADHPSSFSRAVATSYVTYAIIALCCIAFLLTLAAGGFSGIAAVSTHAALRLGALNGPAVRAGEWWRLLSATYLHGSLIHLGMNMLALFYFGSLLERWLGHGRLAIIYTFCGVTGSLASLWWHPDPGIVGLGASGAIFGLMGTMLAIYWRFRQDFPARMRRQFLGWLKQLLFYNLIFSLLPGIDLSAHVGGLIGGCAMGLVLASSPYRRAASAGWVWSAAAAVLAATGLLGWRIIAGIPLPPS